MSVTSTHQFADATIARIPGLQGHDCELSIAQQPERGKVAIGKEKDRKPVDPPPVVQLKISKQRNPSQSFLQSPYFFVSCSLIGTEETGLPSKPLGTSLAGTLVSSLHRLKDKDNFDGAYFVFGDLSIKIQGVFRLQFNLYEMRGDECFHLQSVQSNSFQVWPGKDFPGMAESTVFTRSISDQGVRLRLRKEPRSLLKRDGPSSDVYHRRTYRPKHKRQRSVGEDRRDSVGHTQSQQSQPENTESMQLPLNTSPNDQRLPAGRGFSHHSSASISSFSDEGANKRSHTDAERSPYSHQPLISPQFGGRPTNESQHNYSHQYNQNQASQATYSFNFSPTSISSQDHYFLPRLDTQTDNPASFGDPNGQRSPIYYSPQPQQQPMRMYQPVVPQPSAVLPQRRYASHQYPYPGSEGMNPRPQTPLVMQPSGAVMGPPLYGRKNTSPTTYGYLQNSPPGIRRDRDVFGDYSSSNQNVSGATIGGILMVPTTSAPTNIENNF